MLKRTIILALALLSAGVSLCAQNTRTLHIVTTGDVHGAWFDQPYVEGGRTKTSLMSVKHYVDSLRNAAGRDNVLLLDAGDCLQGDNASYYYNYVDTLAPHLFPRLVHYMGYDALTLGNHDLETGHKVYDKVSEQLRAYGIPWLGGNVLRTSDGLNYFPIYSIFYRAGLKVVVMGFENPNIKSWLSEDQWAGMEFVSLVPYVQNCADIVNQALNPDVLIAVIHSGTGDGDGSSYESQGLDVFKTLHGVDVLVCGHDHRTALINGEGKVLLNGGSRAGYVGHATVSCSMAGRDMVSKSVNGEIVRLDKNRVDEKMRQYFSKEWALVRDFTVREVGNFTMSLATRDAYVGMCDYLNLLHSVQLSVPEAKISFAAPLTFDGGVKAGTVIFNDMFTIYPYENQMSVVNMTGAEIKAYLEYSYDQWIQTPGDHVLKIQKRPDQRTGRDRWSFVERSYNFDSAGGLIYTVDVTAPFGQRVSISSLADGSPFKMNVLYPVAMTSYRANGGGGLLEGGAGLDDKTVEQRTVARYPEIRDLVYEFIKDRGTVSPETIGDRNVIGEWKFVPDGKVEAMLEADMKLLF